MSKKQQRCEVEDLIRLIGGRWKVLILHEIAQGNRRHGQLLRTFEGISQKILTQRLRELEKAGVLRRDEFLEGRIKAVDYSLTEWGEEVMHIVMIIHDWALANGDRLATPHTPDAGAS